MHVLGTAGHVDHGKSALVRALSGTDPDRLPEEKERGLTIELGFASFETDAGPLGIVDVPGHERFVRTMIAGAGGIDIVMFVVAADDGWMPQSQEHLEILRLLEVDAGLIVLSKVDLVEPAWLDMVTADIRTKTKGTFLADAPIVHTDAIHGVGIDELKSKVAELQRSTARKKDLGRARLAVDRVFTMTGQGTVVTGTLRDGCFECDQTIHLFPGAQTVRIRSLQMHGSSIDRARPGSRVAANLAGLDRHELHRGTWLFTEPALPLPRYVGVEIEILTDVPFPLKHRMPMLVIFGTTEVSSRLILPDSSPLVAGRKAVAQIELLDAVTARFGDTFVVRLPSPQITVGGGRFLDPSAFRYGRKHSTEWQRLRDLAHADASGWVAAEVTRARVVSTDSLYPFFPGSASQFEDVLKDGAEDGHWLLSAGHLIDPTWWKAQLNDIEEAVKEFHSTHPSMVGPASTEIFADVPEAIHAKLLTDLESHHVRAEGPALCHQSHRAGLTPGQKTLADTWRAVYKKSPFAGPSRSTLLGEAPEARATLEFLLKSGELCELKDGVILRTEDFDKAIHVVVNAIRKDGSITVGAFRELIGTTRKYALPILDRSDRMGYTKRNDDQRVLGPRADELAQKSLS